MPDNADPARRIGAGPFPPQRYEPSPAWFPHLVRPDNLIDYWIDLDDDHFGVLASHWLLSGFDSAPLRWLAGLDRAALRHLTASQIIWVLHSLGVDIETASQFIARCDRAIARVQVDLDESGFGEYLMHAADASASDSGLPSVYAALVDGRWHSSGSAMTQDLDDDALVLLAAGSVTDTLIECERIFWPTCAVHHGPPMDLLGSKTPSWWCDRGNHEVAPLGSLEASAILH